METSFEPPVIHKIYKLYETVIPILAKFPKNSRYTVAQRIDSNLLEMLENIIHANMEIKNLREIYVQKASAKAEVLKILFRLCSDLKFITERQYIEFESETKEIGRMLGGWIKYLRTK